MVDGVPVAVAVLEPVLVVPVVVPLEAPPVVVPPVVVVPLVVCANAPAASIAAIDKKRTANPIHPSVKQ